MESSYFRLWRQKAVAESKAFWTEHRIFAFVATPVVSALCGAVAGHVIAHQSFSMTTIFAAIVALPFTLIAMALLRFSYDLIFAPSLIHADARAEIERLQVAAFPPVPPAETRRRARVSEILGNMRVTDVQKRFLRILVDEGPLHGIDSDRGIAWADGQRTILSGLAVGILVEDYPRGYAVKPELKDALDAILSAEGF